MGTLEFGDAIDDALGRAMADDSRIVVLGEDVPMVRRDLLVRFGKDRVLGTPISESAFVGAAVSASMSGLRPVVEVMLVDFIGVAMDPLLNHAAKVEAFSGGRMHAPMVIRTTCGGGYGDGGQHEQSLWGWLAHIPGVSVVVPSTPADAGGLLIAAIEHEGPVVFMEHKLLSQEWLELLGGGRRETVSFDVPPDGARGEVPDRWEPIPLGRAVNRREGDDLTIASVGVGVHRSQEAAARLEDRGIFAGVLDLRSVAPLDVETILEEISHTGALLVVDEDYERFGLSGELAAVALEADCAIDYDRVCTKETIPYARDKEHETLPNVDRIVTTAVGLIEK